MAKGHVDPGKKYLSHTLAQWACSLRYEHLSEKAIQTAKLFWFDSLGCALGGSQQEDARILLEHYREMSGQGKGGRGPSTTFVSGFRTNTVDPWATRMGVESALLAKRGYSGPEHIIDGKEGLYAVFSHVHPPASKGEAARFDTEKLIGGLPKSPSDHYRIIDCGMKSFPI